MLQGILQRVDYPTGGSATFDLIGGVQYAADNTTRYDSCQTTYHDMEVEILDGTTVVGRYPQNGPEIFDGIDFRILRDILLSEMATNLQAGVGYTFRVTSRNNKAKFTLDGNVREFLPRPVGGLRLRRLTLADDGGQQPDVVRDYRYHRFSDTTRSSAILNRQPRYHFAGFWYETGADRYVVRFPDNSNAPLMNYEGRHLLYREVTEAVEGGGETRYTYYNSPMVNGDVGYFNSNSGLKLNLQPDYEDGELTGDSSWVFGYGALSMDYLLPGTTNISRLHGKVSRRQSLDHNGTVVADETHLPAGYVADLPDRFGIRVLGFGQLGVWQAYYYPLRTGARLPGSVTTTVDGVEQLQLHEYDADETTVFTDNRGLLTYSQDGNQRAAGKWLHFHYDSYGRQVKSGLVSPGANPDGDVVVTIAAADELTTSVYGDAGNISAPIEMGKLLSSTEKVLDPGSGTIARTFTYDAYGRVHTATQNTIVSGLTNYNFEQVTTTNTYDFADNLLTATKTYERTSGSDLVLTYGFEYDHSGRLERQTFSSPSVTNGTVELCKTTYTLKDEVATKQLGHTGSQYLQTVDYDYLPNGFLSAINDPVNIGNDLFALALRYDGSGGDLVTGAPPRKNGNIAELRWYSPSTTRVNTYGYEYDSYDRLERAYSGVLLSGSHDPTNDYGTSYAYDERGNITTLTRRGHWGAPGQLTPATIDDLNYTYAAGTNRLTQVADQTGGSNIPPNITIDQPVTSSSAYSAGIRIEGSSAVSAGADVSYTAGDRVTLAPGFSTDPDANGSFSADIDPSLSNAFLEGFIERSAQAYTYDANGNQTSNYDKEFVSVEYNHLNLPRRFELTGGRRHEITYTATGEKLALTVLSFTGGQWQTDYVHYYLPDLQLRDDDIEAIFHAEGRAVKLATALQPSSFAFDYNLTDHLGNVRVTFRTADHGGTVPAADVTGEYHYYPFGMAQRGKWEDRADETMRMRYNGKEFSKDLMLHEYGFRWYDSAIGRFTGVDPISDQFPHVSTYNYAENEPIANIDLHGLQKVSIHLIGAVTSRQNGTSQRTPFAFSATVDQGQNNRTNVAGSIGALGFAAEYSPRSGTDFSPAPGEAVNAEVRQKILEAELGTIGLLDIATVTGIESAAESLRGQVSDEKSSAENLGLQLGADALDVLASLVDSDQLRVAFGYDGSEGVGYNEEGEPYLRKLTGIVSLTVKDGTVTLILDDNTTLEYRAAATYTAESCQQNCDDDD